MRTLSCRPVISTTFKYMAVKHLDDAKSSLKRGSLGYF